MHLPAMLPECCVQRLPSHALEQHSPAGPDYPLPLMSQDPAELPFLHLQGLPAWFVAALSYLAHLEDQNQLLLLVCCWA
jgi:hypothetical protein